MNSASRGFIGALLGMLLALAAHDVFAQPVGQVLIAAGEVVGVRGGVEAPLASGAPIQNGDIIRTGEASNAQLRFVDGTLVALRARSRFHVADYRYGGANDASASGVFSLLQGGLRAITGLIGRDRHRMSTPIATLGIRGTSYALVHCAGDCEADEEGSAPPDGTYGLVFEGRVGVANAGGEREFGQDEAFFVADANTPARPIDARPRLLRDRLEARARREQRREQFEARMAAMVERREQMARLTADGRATVVGTPLSPIVVTELQDGSGNVALLGSGLGAGVGFSTAAAAVGLVDGGRGTVIQLDGTRGFLDRFSFNSGAQEGDRGNALVLDNGRAEGDGGAVWGRWAPGASIRVGDAIARPGTGVHFLFGNLTPASLFNAVPPGLTSVRYDLAGGPRPTDESGNPGALLGGSFVVDFLHRSIGGNIAYRVSDVAYSLPVPDGTPLATNRGFVGFTVAGVDAGRWACPTCSTTTGTLGHYNVSGLFFGSRAQGLGVVFGTQDPIVGRSAGAAFFRCVSGGCR